MVTENKSVVETELMLKSRLMIVYLFSSILCIRVTDKKEFLCIFNLLSISFHLKVKDLR